MIHTPYHPEVSMTDARKAAIVEALTTLNWHYGRGDFVSADFDKLTFTRKPFQCREEVRTFKIKGDTLYAMGHQRKLAA